MLIKLVRNQNILGDVGHVSKKTKMYAKYFHRMEIKKERGRDRVNWSTKPFPNYRYPDMHNHIFSIFARCTHFMWLKNEL